MASLLSGAGEADVSSMVPSEMQTSPHPSLTRTSTPTLIETSCLPCRQGYTLILNSLNAKSQIRSLTSLQQTFRKLFQAVAHQMARKLFGAGIQTWNASSHSFCIEFRQQIRLLFSEVAELEDGFDTITCMGHALALSLHFRLGTIGPPTQSPLGTILISTCAFIHTAFTTHVPYHTLLETGPECCLTFLNPRKRLATDRRMTFFLLRGSLTPCSLSSEISRESR
jgi:hypothetical protein